MGFMGGRYDLHVLAFRCCVLRNGDVHGVATPPEENVYRCKGHLVYRVIRQAAMPPNAGLKRTRRGVKVKRQKRYGTCHSMIQRAVRGHGAPLPSERLTPQATAQMRAAPNVVQGSS